MEDNSNTNCITNTNSNTNQNNSTSSATNKNSRCNLIVNYLPQSLKEHDFNNLFSKIGPLKSCKLMFDRQTGYSFGYGFVEYVNEEDAIKAIDTLNGYQIEHKRLKVAMARPNCEDTKNTNLYIRNIPITFDEQQLHNLFSQYGDVVQVRLLRDQNTAFTRRIGFVIMATKQMAQLAIQHLDNTIPPNGGTEPIFVKYADEEGKKRHAPNPNQSNMRMTSHPNFSQNTSNYLTQAVAAQQNFGFNQASSFMQTGLNPLNLGKMKNRSSSHQNRYNPIGANATAAATIQASSQQQSALNTSGSQPTSSYNPWNIPPANISGYSTFSQTSSSQTNIIDPAQQMDLAKQIGANVNGHIIYVYGIGQANESDLYSLFTNCGRILRVNVIKNQKTGQCKGYGFVVFEAYEEAYCAVHTMNGFMYNNRPLQVSFKSFQNITSVTGPVSSSLSSSNRPENTNTMLDTYSNLGPTEMNNFY